MWLGLLGLVFLSSDFVGVPGVGNSYMQGIHEGGVIHSFCPLQKHVQAADALTRGLKSRRRYRWYGVWDVWRRILFVAANLFISVTTRNVVLVGRVIVL